MKLAVADAFPRAGGSLKSILLGAATAVFCCAAIGVQAQAVPAGAAVAPAPSQTGPLPQVIIQSQEQQRNGPDWNRTNSTTANRTGQKTDDRDKTSDTTTIVDTPTEFQTLVSQTIGGTLPIFGSNLFFNVPSTFAPANDVQVTPDYVIGPGDEIRISATGQLNQQVDLTVDRGGTISIPEVGTLTVAGLRFGDLKPFLRQQIGRVYRNFELNVTLGDLRSIQVYILGETRRPGSYTVSSLSTLVNALFVSGGVRPQGSMRRIELRRGGRTVTTIDLYDLLLRGDKSKDAQLQSGDIIFVPTVGPQVAVLGSVTDPAIYELKDEATLGQLLQLASGLTSTATGTGARIESVFDHTQRTLQDVNIAISGGLPLHNGDIVTVAAISDRYKDAVTLRGNVANPGRYTWHTGMRLADLLPNQDALVTRNYYRQRNLLGQPAALYQPAQGHIAVSTAPTAGVSTGNTTEAPTPTAANTANGNGSGTTVGDALTQSNGTFSATNDVVLSAPDVDLAYAVIERLDPVSLTTSLLPFNLGAVLKHTDPTQNLVLEAGDVVTIFSKADIRVPQSQQTRFVRLEGEFSASGVYSVNPGETLRSLITRSGGLTPDAYLFGSEFTRQSTRRVEQQRLREYADTLETQINSQVSSQIAGATDPTGTAQTANAAASSARAAVERMRTMQATGRIVLKVQPDAHGVDAIPDLPLEDGDRFIVPRQPTSIAVAGQVYNASSFLFEPGLQVGNYLRDAGGPDRNADPKRLFVIRADGSVVSKQYGNVLKAPVLPGDTIVMPPQLTRRSLLRDIVTISTALGSLAIPLSVLALVK